MNGEKKSQRGPRTRVLDGTAFFISAAFSPYLLSVLFVLLISFLYAESLKQFLPWILISLFFIGIIPAGYIFWLLENKKVSDIHLSRHQERKIPFLVGASSALIGVLLLYFLGAAKPILTVVLAYAANAVLICIITWYWKISIHSAFFTASVLIVMLFFGPKFWPLFFLWIPLAWARVHRKKHTPEQILAGAVVAILVTMMVFYFLGYKIGS